MNFYIMLMIVTSQLTGDPLVTLKSNTYYSTLEECTAAIVEKRDAIGPDLALQLGPIVIQPLCITQEDYQEILENKVDGIQV